MLALLVFIENLICVWHYSRHWEYSRGQRNFLPLQSVHSSGSDNDKYLIYNILAGEINKTRTKGVGEE